MIKIYSILKIYMIALIVILLSLISFKLFAQETRQLAVDKPQAIADLKTTAGAALVNAKWFVQPAHVHDADFKTPGAGTNGDKLPLYPTGVAIKTHTVHPQIGATDFDAAFKMIQP